MDSHYEAIKSKTKYYVISDIHGDLTLFIKFLVGVYNNLSSNEYYIEDKQFHYFKLSDEITNNIKSTNSVIYEYDNIFKIINKDMQIPYVTFINSLNESLKSNNSCIVLNGDTFNNHYQLADKTQPPFDYLKINKDNNKLTLLNLSLNTNKEFITKLIEISIIYDSIRLLNDNLLFIVGNHELYLLANDNDNNYAINNCSRVKTILEQQSIGGDGSVRIHKPKRNRDVNIKEKTIAIKQPIKTEPINTFLNELQDFILDNGYVELITDQRHIQHAPNTNNYLSKNKCNFNTKLIDVLDKFKCFNIVDMLKNKVSNVDGYNKLCGESIYNNDIYGHTPNEKILRCDLRYKNYHTKFFIDRQYSIYEIIKNIKINYDELLKSDKYKQQKLSNNTIASIKTRLNSDEHINNMICGLIYYYCIQNKFILLYDRTENKIINNKNYSVIDENEAINDCIDIYNKLLIRHYDIYYQLNVNSYATTYNMYIAQIFSLCYRFNSMYAINNQENKKPIKHDGYQLFEQINITCLMCDVKNNIRQIIF